MSLLSPTRLRWKTIVLSFALIYAIYFFGALDNVADRRDILEKIQNLKDGTSDGPQETYGADRPKSTHQYTHNVEKIEPDYQETHTVKTTGLADGTTTSPDGDTTTIPAGFRKPKGVEENPPVDPDVDGYIAFCVAVKNQSRDLPEFLMHHYYNMGVGHFYIMDDGSVPPLSTFVESYGIPRSALTFDYKPFGNKTVQYMQYALDGRCIHKHGRNHTWMAFIDADEFIETRGNDTLVSILNELDAKKHVGALAINWRIHTSAGLLTRPESSRKGFTQCIGDEDSEDGTEWMDNKGIKSIVKVKSYKLPMNPHQFYLFGNQTTVGEHGDPLSYGASRTPITRDRIGLHHYAIKSRGEFEEKMTRWTAKGWDYWEHIEKYRVLHNCTEMQKYDP